MSNVLGAASMWYAVGIREVLVVAVVFSVFAVHSNEGHLTLFHLVFLG